MQSHGAMGPIQKLLNQLQLLKIRVFRTPYFYFTSLPGGATNTWYIAWDPEGMKETVYVNTDSVTQQRLSVTRSPYGQGVFSPIQGWKVPALGDS